MRLYSTSSSLQTAWALPALAGNGLPVARQGKEGHNLFIQDDKYFIVYALYFAKFLDAYQQHGIRTGIPRSKKAASAAGAGARTHW